jgi:hypothetical protein
MIHHRRPATWLGAALGSLCALLVLAIGAHASDHRGALTEEFHQTYAITSDGLLARQHQRPGAHYQLGPQRSEVDASYADTKERLEEAKISLIPARTMSPSAPNTRIITTTGIGARTTILPVWNTP